MQRPIYSKKHPVSVAGGSHRWCRLWDDTYADKVRHISTAFATDSESQKPSCSSCIQLAKANHWIGPQSFQSLKVIMEADDACCTPALSKHLLLWYCRAQNIHPVLWTWSGRALQSEQARHASLYPSKLHVMSKS